MPKISKHPRLRVSVKRGKAGQVWTSYWYDNRGTGKPDVALGTNREEALRRWAEIHLDGPRIAGTLEEAFKAWELDEEDGLLAPRLSKHTRTGYAKNLKAIRPVLGKALWADVTLPVLAQYVKLRTAKTRARQEMQLLSVIWGWSRLRGLTALPYPAVGMQRSAWKGLAKARTIQVSDAAFDALHKHADQTLRDALDIMTATGLRIEDTLRLPLSDSLALIAGKTGKGAEFDLALSTVLPPIIERRKAMRGPEHLFLLAAGRKPVTYRMLADRFTKARKAAALEVPECKGLFLRDMRKRAANLAPTLAAASELLQHASQATTRKHYRSTIEKLKPTR